MNRGIRSNRLRFLVVAGLSLLLFGLFGAQPAAAEKPSVVLITIDTLRADRLGAYGYSEAKTPAIDRLAADGALFEQAMAQTPITLPSHATIMTSTYPIYHGLQDVIGRLRNDIPTMAERFSERGYVTGAFVGASVLMRQWGLARGFDVYEDSFSADFSNQVDFDRVERPAEEVVQLAGQWLEEIEDKPVFLWVHLFDPHDPYAPPEPFATEFRERPYDGEIAYADAMLAKLFGKLREQGLYESSLIVLTADHGEMLGEHGEAFHAFFIYQSALHVPLIIRLPSDSEGLFSPGLRLKNQVRSVDILPTILELLGEPVPDWAQGESLVPLLTRKRDESLPAYAETHYPRVHFNWSPLFSYSNGVYKYIEAPNPELYNLEDDPGERNNLYPLQTAVAHQLQEEMYELQKQHLASGDSSSDSPTEIDPATLERLKALGYVGFTSGSQPGSDSEDSRSLPDPKDKIQSYNTLNRGIELSRQGKSQEAISLFRELAQKESEMPIVHFMLGMEYFSSGNYLLAIEQFEETLERNPESNVARFNLARAHARAGLSSRAQGVARQLLRIDPTHFAARHFLARLLAAERRFEEAIAEELKALEQRPEFPEAHNNLGSYYLNVGKVEEAIESYKKALEYAPDHRLAAENLALAYLNQKDFDQALEASRRALRINPRSSLAHYYAGQAYLAKGMPEQARQEFETAKMLDPNLNIPRF